jgi:hypothetical protein
VKLACFGATSWHELKSVLGEIAPRPSRHGTRPKPRPAPRDADPPRADEPHRSLLSAVFEEMIGRLVAVVPDTGTLR